MSSGAAERSRTRASFEQRYANLESEPWNYEARAVELLRLDWIAATIRRLQCERTTSCTRVLDVGCSLGQISARLSSRAIALTAVDISANAVRRAAERLSSRREANDGSPVSFLTGTAVELPVRDGAFDIIVAADGLYSWDLSKSDRALALAELRRTLASDGRILFTDHMRSSRFEDFVAEIRDAGFGVTTIEYLYDRPWYQFESWTRAVQGLGVVEIVRKNLMIARLLCFLGRAIGPRASRHICVIATR